ncbi:MAG TPA: c-type cytochrome biogenesis protein CcmI [Dongiaceae bacterium]
MIWFWIIAGSLVLVALILLLTPLVRGAGRASDQGESVVALFRRQLSNLETEIAQGRLDPEEAADMRAEITRRMLAAADQESHDLRPGGGRSSEMPWRVGAAVGIAGLLPAAALAVYAAVGTPAAIDPARGAAAGGDGPHDRAKLAAAAEQLKERLQREPGHVEGWVLLGRTFASLERFADARQAYDQAIALAPNEPRLHAELGELVVLTAGGVVTPEAQAEFAKAGDDPRARFYGAEAALQRGDREAAKSALKALLAAAPAEAPWRQAVAERLAEIAPDEQPPSGPAGGSPSPIPAGSLPSAGSPSAGPSSRDVAAAQSMSPEERQAMIRGMIDRLAARLEQNPDDKEGWNRLAHAYDVLGEAEKAASARTRAAQIQGSGR